MAGLGRKTFIATEVLTAANVNGYLMDQSVMKFANTAAASSAVGTAISEGMQFYLSDTDEQVFYNGSSFAKQNGTTNALINGAFDIWQRGTSKTLGAFDTQYLADRWYGFSGSSHTFAQESTTVPANSRYALKLTATSTGNFGIHQAIETANTLPLIGKTVTLSAEATGTTGKSIRLIIEYSTTVDQSGVSGWTELIATTQSAMTAGTFVRYSVTATIPSTARTLRAVIVGMGMVNTDYVIVGNVQLEAGSVATPFKRNAPSIQAELAACQRYYWRQTGGQSPSIGQASYYSTTNVYPVIKHPVKMRVDPTFTPSAVTIVNTYVNGTTRASTNIFASLVAIDTAEIGVTTSSIGTAGLGSQIAFNAGYFEFSAEL